MVTDIKHQDKWMWMGEGRVSWITRQEQLDTPPNSTLYWNTPPAEILESHAVRKFRPHIVTTLGFLGHFSESPKDQQLAKRIARSIARSSCFKARAFPNLLILLVHLPNLNLEKSKKWKEHSRFLWVHHCGYCRLLPICQYSGYSLLKNPGFYIRILRFTRQGWEIG
jgi:hypothetical protein